MPSSTLSDRWPTSRWSALLVVLSVATFLVHGYHPLAEDGGLYVAGVELTLDPKLFPHYTQFVSEHLRFSIFAPTLAALIRSTHLPLMFALLLVDLASIAITLAAARSLLRRMTSSDLAQLAGVSMLAALWTLPIAGTSLLLMDPYVTARSLSTPLSLWSIAFALDPWNREKPRSLVGCIGTLALAAAFHPLMAGYALGFVIVIRILRSPQRFALPLTLGLLILVVTFILQTHAPADSAAVALASKSRYYWFLSQWQWYEIFGLIGPFLILGAHLRFNRARLLRPGVTLCIAAMLYGCFAVLLTLLFAHESYPSHIVARLQPLRVFLMIYIVMVLLLGAGLLQLIESGFAHLSSRWQRWPPYVVGLIILIAAIAMYTTQREQFPASTHIELPWRANPNPWVQAFLWCRDNTPADALFALDAHYITSPGEDAQAFRATAERSALPDFSKDGGEASITPRLADQWLIGFTAQLDLSSLNEHALRLRLAPFGVTWLVLRSTSPAVLNCPYDNGDLKVCKL